MNTIFRCGLAALVLVATAGWLSAQEISPDQAQALHKDAVTAKQAVERILKNAQSEDVKTDAGEADRALSRVIEGLAAHDPVRGDADPYAGGTKYPPIATARIESFDVPVGTTEIHVPVTLDRQSPNTVIVHVRVFDGEGGRADPDTTRWVIFRPGDPLTKTATFKVRSMSEGNNVRVVQPAEPDGGKRGGSLIRATARAGAVNEPITGGREALTFQPRGTLVYSAAGETIEFDDNGGSNRFSTALPHGRTQPGNGETGYYGTVDMEGFKRTPEGLVLDTRRLDEPVKVGSPATEYPFLASMLSGHRTPETHFKHGSVEWVVKMPNRSGAWPALWLLPTRGWPPEIDVYEGFGYNDSWRFPAHLSTNLHGGEHQRRTFTRPAMNMTMSTFGLPNTLDSEFHTFAVTVDAEWITMFVDGVETMRYANPFDGETWYPLTNVAVKAKVDSPYNTGTGAMTLRSLKIWRDD